MSGNMTAKWIGDSRNDLWFEWIWIFGCQGLTLSGHGTAHKTSNSQCLQLSTVNIFIQIVGVVWEFQHRIRYVLQKKLIFWNLKDWKSLLVICIGQRVIILWIILNLKPFPIIRSSKFALIRTHNVCVMHSDVRKFCKHFRSIGKCMEVWSHSRILLWLWAPHLQRIRWNNSICWDERGGKNQEKVSQLSTSIQWTNLPKKIQQIQ